MAAAAQHPVQLTHPGRKPDLIPNRHVAQLLRCAPCHAAHGILEATATTAVAMTEQQAKSLHEKLEKLTGKTIDLKTKVDPAVLGGIRLDIEGTELDGTVQNRLAALRRDIASVTL